jgi:hypothetical protein
MNVAKNGPDSITEKQKDYLVLDPEAVIPYEYGRKIYSGRGSLPYTYKAEHMGRDGRIAVFVGSTFQGYTKTHSGFISALDASTLTDEQLAAGKPSGVCVRTNDPALINLASSRVKLDAVNLGSQAPLGADTVYYAGNIHLSDGIRSEV